MIKADHDTTENKYLSDFFTRVKIAWLSISYDELFATTCHRSRKQKNVLILNYSSKRALNLLMIYHLIFKFKIKICCILILMISMSKKIFIVL